MGPVLVSEMLSIFEGNLTVPPASRVITASVKSPSWVVVMPYSVHATASHRKHRRKEHINTNNFETGENLSLKAYYH